jgi:hypothetical protein
MSFVSMRLQKDAETTRDMMGYRNPADMTAVQSCWVEDPPATTMPRWAS